MKEIKRAPEVGVAFSDGWRIYKDNFGVCLVSCLLVLLIGGASCAICMPPLIVGFGLICIRLLRNDPTRPQIGDVFKGFSFFGPSFLTMLVLGVGSFIVTCLLNIVPILGQLVSLLLSFAVIPAMNMLATALIGDQSATAGQAISTPLKLLSDGRFWKFVLVVFLASIVSTSGMILCGIGIIFTIPLGYTIMFAAYEQMYGGDPEVIDVPSEETNASPSV